MIQRTATRLPSPPRLAVAGVASARVRLREANDRLRAGEMPSAAQSGGYPKREAIAMVIFGMMIEADLEISALTILTKDKHFPYMTL